jgi:hypothetical protein
MERRASGLHACLSRRWSLGANILVNYLGTVAEDTPLSAAVSLCNPFNLTIGIGALEKGFNKIYDVNLAKAMRAMVERNAKVWNAAGVNFDVGGAAVAPSVRAWDDAITRVSFGAGPCWQAAHAQTMGACKSSTMPQFESTCPAGEVPPASSAV